MQPNNSRARRLSRRFFLRASLMAAAGQALIISGCHTSKTAAATPGSALGPIGLQLYSVPVLLQQDFRGTLKTIADIGYKELEFAGPYDFGGTAGSPTPSGGYYGNSPAQVKAMLDEFHLSAPSAHIPRKDLQNNLSAVIDAAHIVGHRYLIVPFLGPDERSSLDSYKALADELNTLANRLKPEGIQIGYHNHSFEFGKTDGQQPYDLLLANTDKDLVKFELDLFWISEAGLDPIEYLKKYPNRFPLVHCKNMATKTTLKDPLHSFDTKEATAAAFDNQTNLSNGVIDFPHILAAAKQSGVEHFIVERDRTKDVATAEQELVTIRDGYTYLSKLQLA